MSINTEVIYIVTLITVNNLRMWERTLNNQINVEVFSLKFVYFSQDSMLFLSVFILSLNRF